ncbi:MAG TPA: prephenate dehydratase [Candidatus Aphodovivens avistercoris]|nr:prephenate dehydratase [Candidatus Aphodovivens avistercoris]
MTESAPKLAFLGPVGTYSDEAARRFAERLGAPDAQLVECASFDEVFDCVDRGKCEYGVVAKENSLEGPVTATLDNFAFKSSAVILGEEVIDIHHCLVTHPDAKWEDITSVASHAQGLAQCRRFLAERLPGRAAITTSSTAESARLAASDPHVAGIANELAAQLHGAAVRERGIEDHFGNQTCFALIGRQGHEPVFQGPRMKTSLALFLNVNRAGTLHMILSEFAYAGIDLSMIQSRPTKQTLGDYMFFIEFEQSVNDLAVQTALNCLRLKLREVKVLGSYPIL